MNKIIKNTLSLTLITVVLGGVLGAVRLITAEPIAQQEIQKKQEACEKVFADADSFVSMDLKENGWDVQLSDALVQEGFTEAQIDGVYYAVDEKENQLGYVLEVTSGEGYGGDIQFAMGITGDGTIQGISFLSINETAGLGMRANTDAFKSQFAGKKADAIAYSKTGALSENEIDALSGATVTTNAVTNGVNAGLCAFRILEEGGQSR